MSSNAAAGVPSVPGSAVDSPQGALTRRVTAHREFVVRKTPALQSRQPAFGGKVDQLGIGPQAGLGLDEIVIVLNGLRAEIEI
jgi:hypothetical protein